MPVARYQLEDGRVARFEVPEGTTPEQAQQIGIDYFASNQPPDSEPQQQENTAESLQQSTSSSQNPMGENPQQVEAPEGRGLVDMVTGSDRQTELTQTLPELTGILEGEDTGLVAKVAALMPVTTDPMELADIITTSPNIVKVFNKDAKGNVFPVLHNVKTGKTVQVNKPGFSQIDAIQAGGTAAAFFGAGKAGTIPAAVLKNAGTQAAIEGAQASAGGEADPTQIAMAGGVGGAFKGAENVAGGVLRASKGSPNNELVEAGAEAGIPVMTSDVLPPENFVKKHLLQTAEKIPVAGTGKLRQAQQQRRQEAVDKVAQKYGEFSYDAIVSSLKTQKDKIKNAAGSVLENTGKKLDEVGEIPILKTRLAISESYDQLNKAGVLKSGGALEDISTLLKTLNEAPQTFSSLKENRTAFREIINGADKADRTQLTSRSKSLLNKVGAAIKEDMTQFAENNLSKKEFVKWQKANTVYAQEARKLTKTKLKNVLDKGDITPEAVKSMLFSQNASETKLLFNSLTSSGKSNARSAIISKIVGDLSKRQSGFTPNSFASELKKHKMQIGTFFKGEERKQLEGLRKLLEATRRAQDASITTPTGQQLTGALSIAGLAAAPTTAIGTAGTLGYLSQLYESAPVRNALLRLGSAPKGSTRFEQALREVQSILNSGAQTTRATSAGESPLR